MLLSRLAHSIRNMNHMQILAMKLIKHKTVNNQGATDHYLLDI